MRLAQYVGQVNKEPVTWQAAEESDLIPLKLLREQVSMRSQRDSINVL